MWYEGKYTTVTSKEFAPFSATLAIANNNIDATTMIKVAQAKETVNHIAQVQPLSAKLQILQQTAQMGLKETKTHWKYQQLHNKKRQEERKERSQLLTSLATHANSIART